MDATLVIAIITGLAGIVTACGGVLLAVRAVRSRERKAANKEIEQLSDLLTVERQQHVDCEVLLQTARMLLAKTGTSPDEPDSQ